MTGHQTSSSPALPPSAHPPKAGHLAPASSAQSVLNRCLLNKWLCSPVFPVVKNLPANAGDTGDSSSIPGSRRSSGGGNGIPLQYSCLGKSMDGGAWRTMVHGVTKGSDRAEWPRMHTHTALSTLLFNIYHYSKTYFQFIALSSYHKAKEHCRKYHLCSSKPLTRSFTRVAFMNNMARNIYLHVALSSTELSLQHAVSRVVMPGQNLWFIFTALKICCQVFFPKGHANFPCQLALGYNKTLPIVRVLLKCFLLLNKVCWLNLAFGWMFMFCFIRVVCLFLCKFSIWLQSLENNHTFKSLTNMSFCSLLGFLDNLTFDG